VCSNIRNCFVGDGSFKGRAVIGRRFLAGTSLLMLSAGCSSYPTWFASHGPSQEQVSEAATQTTSSIRLVDIDDSVARRLYAEVRRSAFSVDFPDNGKRDYTVGPGDALEVSVWEAPPAALFGTTALDPRAGATTSRVTTFPDQLISERGTINVPFAGEVPVAGKTPQKIQAVIAERLNGKANQPQVLVRVTHNATSNVTIVGEVGQSTRMPLTAKGERLLDAIAAAGGVRQPVSKITVQLTRGSQVQSMSLESIIEDPRQNVRLEPGDVVTALYQPLSFTVLGATGKNEEINFEAQGISLAQALARAGGVQDVSADASGVFIFRFEDPKTLSPGEGVGPTTPDGKVPVVYRANLKNPATFLVAQNFPMHNKDVIYVANAPSAELQKFLNILTSSIYSVSSLVTLKP
jgi:polysaccharide export outer membrane protein